MINKAKNGSALILTLAVTSMLIVFAASLLMITISNSKGTIITENASSLKMIAQTGMEKGMAILKDKIATDVRLNGKKVLSDIANTPTADATFNIGLSTNATDEDIPGIAGQKYYTKFNVFDNAAVAQNYGDCYIGYKDGTHLDSSIGIVKNCITITVRAFGKGGSISTNIAYIDKNSISNYYFERIFNNTLTSLGATSNPTDKSGNSGVFSGTKNNIGSIESNSTGQMHNVQIGGDVYIQGNNFNMNANYVHINGMIKINKLLAGNSFSLPFSNTSFYRLSTGDAPTTLYTKPSNYNTWSSFDIRGDFNPGVKAPTAEALTMKALNPITFPGTSDYKDEDTIIQNSLYTPEPSSGIPDMVIIKWRPTNVGDQLDFNKLVLGPNYDSHLGLRRFITTDSNLKAAYQNETDYLRVFKVIMADGDVTIDAAKLYYDEITDNNPGDVIGPDSADLTYPNFRSLNHVNFIIISSGTVTIKGTLKMYNSSITAKHIVFDTSTQDIPVDAVTGSYTGTNFTNIVAAQDKLNKDRRTVIAPDTTAETVPKDDVTLTPEEVTTDTLDLAKNYTNPTLSGEITSLSHLYGTAKTDTAPTSIIMDGIGTEDSASELMSNLSEYESLPDDARGFLSNVQRASMNEYFMQNLTDDYAKEILFKVIAYEEK